MSSVQSIIIFPEPVRTLAFGAIGVGYTAIGSQLINPARIALFQNATDADLMFSWDGVNDHYPLLNGTFLLIDVTSNKSSQGGAFAIAGGTQFWVRQIAAPTVGAVYVTSFYGE